MMNSSTTPPKGSVPAAALGIACGLALPVAAVFIAFLTGFLGADLAANLNLGGDSGAFGEGADGFAVGAFVGFLGTYLIGGFFVALAIRRAYSVPLTLPILCVLAPLILVLLLLIAAL
jgi:hypothetical protein